MASTKAVVSPFPGCILPDMCRILFARADQAFAIAPLLEKFADMSRQSSEFQGHGWGCAWRAGEQWQLHHDINPVWEADFSAFTETKLLLVHARSAFRDEGIAIENNMPFSDGESIFIFNGELRGVRIKSEGRIGAEKIYNYIRRFDRGDKLQATQKAVDIIAKRSSHIRAMNLLLSDGQQSIVSSHYSETPEYFQLHRAQRQDMQLLCSQPLDAEADWQRIENNTTMAL